MQMRLYGARVRMTAPLPDTGMWQLLGRLRSAPLLAAVRLWLVGSRLEPGHDASDIDLVLSPRADLIPSDETIDRALEHCRAFGLYDALPAGIVDPCFRFDGPCLTGQPLAPGALMRGIKLLSPERLEGLLSGRISPYRQVGRHSVEYVLPAGRTGYYRKLPRRPEQGGLQPYLRPAVEIT